MGFVDCEEGDGEVGEGVDEAAADQAFGGDVKELKAAGAKVCEDVAGFGGGEAGVEAGGGDTAFDEGVDLIFHEGDQGGDDDGEAVQEEGGELVAKAFARSRGEDREGGAAFEEGGDDAALAGAELGKAEGIEKEALGVVEARHRVGFVGFWFKWATRLIRDEDSRKRESGVISESACCSLR